MKYRRESRSQGPQKRLAKTDAACGGKVQQLRKSCLIPSSLTKT